MAFGDNPPRIQQTSKFQKHIDPDFLLELDGSCSTVKEVDNNTYRCDAHPEA